MSGLCTSSCFPASLISRSSSWCSGVSLLGLCFPTFKRAPVEPAHHLPRTQDAEEVVDSKILRTLLYLHLALAGFRDPHDEAGHRGHLEQLRGVPVGNVLQVSFWIDPIAALPVDDDGL